jgi:hypothetical protein
MRGLQSLVVFFALSLPLPTVAAQAEGQQVLLGNATVALTGPWRFQIGNNAAWAEPEAAARCAAGLGDVARYSQEHGRTPGICRPI